MMVGMRTKTLSLPLVAALVIIIVLTGALIVTVRSGESPIGMFGTPKPTDTIATWATAAATGDIGAASALMDAYDAAGWRNRWQKVRAAYAVQPEPALRDIEQRGTTTYAVVVYRTESLSPTGAICVPVAVTAQAQIIVQGEHTHCRPSTETTP